MSVCYELFDSRSVAITSDDATTTRRYIITGITDEVTADALLLATAPTSVLSLRRNARNLQPQGGGVWIGEVNYGSVQSAPLDLAEEDEAQPAETAEITGEYSFDTSGNTQHITQSLETRQRVARNGAAAPDYSRAIGVSRDGVAGVDIIVPKLEFQVTRTVAAISLAYIKTLRDVTGKTNLRKSFHYERGELLFLGASGSAKQGEIGWIITYKFLTAKNRSQVILVPGAAEGDPPILAVEDVRGHDYIWVGYEDAIESNTLIQRPKFAYVERVYEEADFRALGLGGA